MSALVHSTTTESKEKGFKKMAQRRNQEHLIRRNVLKTGISLIMLSECFAGAARFYLFGLACTNFFNSFSKQSQQAEFHLFSCLLSFSLGAFVSVLLGLSFVRSRVSLAIWILFEL